MKRRALGSLVIVFPFFLCLAGYVSAWQAHVFSIDGLWPVLMGVALFPLSAVSWRMARWFGVVTYVVALAFNGFMFLSLVVYLGWNVNDRLFFVLLALASVVEVWIISWIAVKYRAVIRNIRSAPEAIRSSARSISVADIRSLVISVPASLIAWAIIAAATRLKGR